MAAITSAQSGNWSASATWTGGVKPGAGDTAVIATGHAVVVDENTTVGSNSAAVGHGINVKATSAAVYAQLSVAAGVTLTLRGFDITNNTMMLIDRYAKFVPAAGSTVLGDLASDGQSIIKNNGHISAIGTAGNLVNFSVPTANIKWDNSATVTYTGAHGPMSALGVYRGSYDTPTGAYNMVYGIGLSKLTGGQENRVIANAAGTGIGSGIDTSLAVNAVTGCISTIKGSLDAITAHGDYFIDHQLGALFHRLVGSGWTISPDITVTYKYLSYFGWGIISNNDATGSSAVFDYCNFSYMGGATYDLEFAGNVVLGIRYKRSANVAADREGRIEHCNFTYCYHPIQLYDSYGNATEKLKIKTNSFIGCMSHVAANSFNKYIVGLGAFGTDTGYLDFSDCHWHSGTMMIGKDRESIPFHDLMLSSNTGNAMTAQYLPDGADNVVSDNTVVSLGGLGFIDSRGLAGQGTAGHPMIYTRNRVAANNRAAVAGANVSIIDNTITECMHHGIVIGFANGYVNNVLIEKNKLYYTDYNDMPGGITFGYNSHTWSDSVVVRNNTFDNGHRSILLGDEGESGVVYGTNVQIYDNIVSNSSYGVHRDPASTATMQNKFNIGRLAKNLEYNLGTASAIRQCIPKIGTAEYNLPATTKNINGVSLWNPNYTTFPVAAKNLQLITSGAIGTDFAASLSWGGGTTVSLVNVLGLGQGTVATATNTGAALGSKITVTGAGWPTTLKQLRGKLCVLTNGTVTIYAMIQDNTATQLTLVTNLNRMGAFALTGTPDIVTNPTTYKFLILDAEAVLSDGTNTITAGVDIARLTLAAGTYTDSVSIDDGLVTGDPAYIDRAAGNFGIQATSAARSAGIAGADIGAFAYVATGDPQTITFGALASKAYGDAAFSLTATASSGLAVSYTSSNTAVATVSGATVTIVGVGSTNITASQAGDGTWLAATPVVQGLTVMLPGSISAIDAGDIASSTGTISVFGALTATAAGDTSSINGALHVFGTLSVAESGDAAALSGGGSAISGTLAVTDPGDTGSCSGSLSISGTLTAAEGADTASISGLVLSDITGTLTIAENGDHAAAAGTVVISGTLTINESGDTVRITNQVLNLVVGDIVRLADSQHIIRLAR